MANDRGRAACDPPGGGLPVVAIGGSAGSAASLQALAYRLPPDAGAAFVVVTHQAPDRPGHLARHLHESSALPVVEVSETLALEANRVYVTAAGAEWTLAGHGGELYLAPRGEVLDRPAQEAGSAAVATGPSHPIDTFLASLADTLGERAVAVILSGTGTDGTAGSRAVQRAGGTVLAEDPEWAEFQAMPASAAATGCVKRLARPAEMPAAIMDSLGARARETRPARSPEAALPDILELVRARSGNDLSGYKPGTLLNRSLRRMRSQRVADTDAYLDVLRNDPGEVDCLFRDVTISVTGFFRDPQSWTALGGAALDAALERASGRVFRAWVIGCATGEEAYSLAMLLDERIEALGIDVRVQIFATDFDRASLQVAREGRYGPGAVEGVGAGRLARHFVAEGGGYRVHPRLRAMVIFAEHNVLHDPPFSHLDLACCRNLMIYLERDLQKRLVQLLLYTLVDDGILFLGPAESAEPFSDALEPLPEGRHIYRRRGSPARRPLPDLPVRPNSDRAARRRDVAHSAAGGTPGAAPVQPLRLVTREPALAAEASSAPRDATCEQPRAGVAEIPDLEPAPGPAELARYNEELRSINEELHSSKEELEISMEEVEALNEDRRSLNEQLEARVGELSRACNDMKNVLEGARVAALFLDEDLAIKGFTEKARDLVALRDGDVGRPIDELVHWLQDMDPAAEARAFLGDLQPRHRRVRAHDGRWYRVHVFPYRTTDEAIEGVAFTFQDIQALVGTESREACLRSALDALEDPLLVVDREWRATHANQPLLHWLGATRDEVFGQPLYALAGGVMDRADIRAMLGDPGTARGARHGDVLLDPPPAGEQPVRLSIRDLPEDGGGGRLMRFTRAGAPRGTDGGGA